MGILSAIWNLITKIFSSILSWLADIFGDWLLIILILVVIWFAPVIVAWLTSVGAPAFMVSMFEAIAVMTPYVQSAAMWLWESGSSLVSTAWQAYRGLDAGTQASIALGAAALIAPEETAALVSETISTVGDVFSVVADAVMSSPGLMIAGGIALWWLFFRKPASTTIVVRDESTPQPAATGG